MHIQQNPCLSEAVSSQRSTIDGEARVENFKKGFGSLLV